VATVIVQGGDVELVTICDWFIRRLKNNARFAGVGECFFISTKDNQREINSPLEPLSK